ncbi:MAG: hypothetical protein N4A32_08195 [Marinifilaceae bacterium]|jgi:phosphate transport system protein|nr:hypothetical protein [Marinilabiliaceae bacterium JC040]MCT4600857.1 hypothetical protein [Marinifilaceae bacterium]
MNAKNKEFENITNDVNMVSEIIFQQMNLIDDYLSNVNNSDSETVNELLSNESKIDDYEKLIYDKIVNCIVLYNPLAGELRQLMASLRITTNLERIGDLCINIIESLESTNKKIIGEKIKTLFVDMLKFATLMVRNSMSSFICCDMDLAEKVLNDDDVIDNLNEKINNLLSEFKHNEAYSSKEELTNLLSFNYINMNIERIADNATNIAEASIYMMQGEDIRHTN